MPIEYDTIRTEPPRPAVRVVTFEGSREGVERALEMSRERVLPFCRELPGWQGMVALVSRDGRRGVTLSFWDSHQAIAELGLVGVDSHEAGEGAVAITDVQRYEVVFRDEAAETA